MRPCVLPPPKKKKEKEMKEREKMFTVGMPLIHSSLWWHQALFLSFRFWILFSFWKTMRQVEIWNQGNLKVSWNLGIHQQCNIAATDPPGQDVSSIGGETQHLQNFCKVCLMWTLITVWLLRLSLLLHRYRRLFSFAFHNFSSQAPWVFVCFFAFWIDCY